MRTYPCVLTIAGSDCSGGAGIQADIKAISALGAYAASAITAITVQNTLGVTGIHPVPPAYVKGQIEAVMDDIRPKAVKIGMINDAEIVCSPVEPDGKFFAGIVSGQLYKLAEYSPLRHCERHLFPNKIRKKLFIRLL